MDPPDGGVTVGLETKAVIPAGAEALKLTAELNVFNEFTTITSLSLPPCGIDIELGAVDKEKSGDTATVRFTVVV